ncbi:MAG: polysaccharide deacetylase [Candidatus Bathyarchaeota archaeon]|nr:polysaccharide deacetylase [Candidatus Bathyarchaeota archaeon]
MPIVLPKGKKCAVILSWDFDAMAAFVLRGETSPTFISRGEFGARVGVLRVLDLCDKYNFKTTFFVPGWTVETYPELTKKIFDKGHEIAHHMWCHEDAPTLSYEKELELMDRAMESIKKVTGKYPVGNRSGGFASSNNTVKLLQDHGYLYDSTQMGDDFNPYRCRIGDHGSPAEPWHFGKESNILELPVSWVMDDWPHFEFQRTPALNPGLATPSDAFEIWSQEFDYMYDNIPNGVYMLTLHPYVSGKAHRIMMIERLIQHMMRQKGVWFCRGEDVARCWKD